MSGTPIRPVDEPRTSVGGPKGEIRLVPSLTDPDELAVIAGVRDRQTAVMDAWRAYQQAVAEMRADVASLSIEEWFGLASRRRMARFLYWNFPDIPAGIIGKALIGDHAEWSTWCEANPVEVACEACGKVPVFVRSRLQKSQARMYDLTCDACAPPHVQRHRRQNRPGAP